MIRAGIEASDLPAVPTDAAFRGRVIARVPIGLSTKNEHQLADTYCSVHVELNIYRQARIEVST